MLRCTFCVQNTPYTRVVWLCSCTDVAHQVLLELTRRNQLEEDGFRSCVQVPSSGIVQDKEENWKSGFPESGAESCCVLELRGCLAEDTAAKESQGGPGQPPLSHPCLSALLGRAPWHWEGTAGGVGLPHCLEKGLLVLAHGSAISYLPELKEFYWVTVFFCTEDACAWYFTWEENQEFTYPCKRPLVMNKLP